MHGEPWGRSPAYPQDEDTRKEPEASCLRAGVSALSWECAGSVCVSDAVGSSPGLIPPRASSTVPLGLSSGLVLVLCSLHLKGARR